MARPNAFMSEQPQKSLFGGNDRSLSLIVAEIRLLREKTQIQYEWIKSHYGLATKQDLMEIETRLMSAISDFAAKQTAFNARIDAGITGISGDVQKLNALIAQLQSSPGSITPEDQAALDALQTQGDALSTKVEALDALTPPAVPPTA